MIEMLSMYEGAISPLLGIKKLFAAILERAFLDITPRMAILDYNVFKGALIWFESDLDDTPEYSEGFTYKTIISTLEFTPRAHALFRQRIEQAKALRSELDYCKREESSVLKSTPYYKRICREGHTQYRD